MTSIVIWKNNEDGESLWAVSDSRITDQNEGHMVEDCPKLYSVPILIQPNEFSSFQFQVNSFGFCFSGSTLVGQTSYLKLSRLMTRLRPLGKIAIENPNDVLAALPTLDNILSLLLQIVSDLVFDLQKYKPKYEIAIFGYCHKNKAFEAYSIQANVNDQTNPITKKIDLDEFYIMGCRKYEISDKIKNKREEFDENTLDWWRTPYIVLKDVLAECNFNAIGGELQVAKSFNNGTEIFFPIEESKVVESTIVLGGFFSGIRKMVK